MPELAALKRMAATIVSRRAFRVLVKKSVLTGFVKFFLIKFLRENIHFSRPDGS